jgi:protein-tyrosine phosphatase
MRGGIYWIEGPWPGRLGVAARPRGGDWLTQELAGWRREGIDTVVSLLTPEEEDEFSLQAESAFAREQGMSFVSVPVRDRQVPDSESEIEAVVRELDAALSARKNVLVHCRQGIGRSGLLAACLLINRGTGPASALEQISATRGTSVPETREQRNWIEQYASRLATGAHAHPRR